MRGWTTKVQAIQENYFKTGPGTHLVIQWDEGSQKLKWTFTILLFGMCHSAMDEVSLQDGDERAALDRVFAGQFDRLLRQVYDDLGFEGV
jgi:hypothetical protein